MQNLKETQQQNQHGRLALITVTPSEQEETPNEQSTRMELLKHHIV
jgi:hypothetical protein